MKRNSEYTHFDSDFTIKYAADHSKIYMTQKGTRGSKVQIVTQFDNKNAYELLQMLCEALDLKVPT